MKKLKLLGITIFLCFLLMPTNGVLANQEDSEQTTEYNIEEEMKKLDEQYSYLNDTDLVLELPDGALLSGPGTLKASTIDNPDIIIEEYNVQLDPNSITLQQYKEKELKKILSGESEMGPITNYGVSTRAAVPPTKRMTLDAGQFYQSAKFSGSGWRYGELYFDAAWGTGDYLRWSTHGDTGNVCRSHPSYPGEARFCYPMNVEGEKYWFSKWFPSSPGINPTPGFLYYQTFNPTPKSYYVVANVDY